jgi:hypothetical protein
MAAPGTTPPVPPELVPLVRAIERIGDGPAGVEEGEVRVSASAVSSATSVRSAMPGSFQPFQHRQEDVRGVETRTHESWVSDALRAILSIDDEPIAGEFVTLRIFADADAYEAAIAELEFDPDAPTGP